MTNSLRAFVCLAALVILSAMPGCTVVEEAFGGSETATQASALEPSAPPPTAGAVNTAATGESPMTRGTPPLVVIRFAKKNVEFEKPLYEAMNATLAQQPEATFYLVAIAPPQATAAGLANAQTESAENIERVVKTMTGMGLPASRITVSSTTNAIASVNEVRVFVR
jgi:hypothetical protein